MIVTGLKWSALALILMLSISVYGFVTLPADGAFPVQWGVDGEVNRTAGKMSVVLALPALAVGLTFLLAVIPLIDPRRRNLEKSAAFYIVAWAGTMAILTLAHGTIVFSAISGSAPALSVLFIGIGIFLAIAGNYMAKSRSNWFAGLRTPWTLSSEHAWTVGNRVAGWGLVITGLLTIIFAIFLPRPYTVGVLMAGTLLSALIGTIASYLGWRQDPHRAAE